MLHAAGLETDPRKIGEKEIRYLRRIWQEQRLNQNYIRWRINHLGLLLRFYKNDILSRMRLNLKPVERSHVRWLSEEEAERLRAAAEALGPQYEIRIHLGLDLLLRKVEMYRLNMQDINWEEQLLNVLGKGRDGGKPGEVPFHPYTEEIMKKYLDWREEQITRAERRGEPVKDRDALLIWYRPGMGVDREHYTTMDNRMLKISKLAGVKCSYHDLRRTGAAHYYWLYGWDLVEVQHLLRHEKIETTIQYLGLKFEIVRKAMWTKMGRRSPHNSPAQPARNQPARNRFVSVLQ